MYIIFLFESKIVCKLSYLDCVPRTHYSVRMTTTPFSLKGIKDIFYETRVLMGRAYTLKRFAEEALEGEIDPVMLGYIGTTLFNQSFPARDIVLPPVVATAPEADFAPITTSTPAIVTSVSAGLTIWPAALFAEQVPVRFAHSQLELTNYTR